MGEWIVPNSGGYQGFCVLRAQGWVLVKGVCKESTVNKQYSVMGATLMEWNQLGFCKRYRLHTGCRGWRMQTSRSRSARVIECMAVGPFYGGARGVSPQAEVGLG